MSSGRELAALAGLEPIHTTGKPTVALTGMRLARVEPRSGVTFLVLETPSLVQSPELRPPHLSDADLLGPPPAAQTGAYHSLRLVPRVPLHLPSPPRRILTRWIAVLAPIALLGLTARGLRVRARHLPEHGA